MWSSTAAVAAAPATPFASSSGVIGCRTHAPEVVTPMEATKNLRVPDPRTGRHRSMLLCGRVALLVFQSVIVQLKIPVNCTVVILVEVLTGLPVAVEKVDRVTPSRT